MASFTNMGNEGGPQREVEMVGSSGIEVSRPEVLTVGGEGIEVSRPSTSGSMAPGGIEVSRPPGTCTGKEGANTCPSSVSMAGGERAQAQDPSTMETEPEELNDSSRRSAMSMRSTKLGRRRTRYKPGPKFTKEKEQQKKGEATAKAAVKPVACSEDTDWEDENTDLAPSIPQEPPGKTGKKKEPASGKAAKKAMPIPPHKKDGRGRPPTTGVYIALRQAKEALIATNKEEKKMQEEAEAERRLLEVDEKLRREMGAIPTEEEAERTGQSSVRLLRMVKAHKERIYEVATKSRNLKGTSQKALKESSAVIWEIMETLVGRTASDEVAVLRAANQRMERQLEELRREAAERRGSKTAPSSAFPPPLPHRDRRKPRGSDWGGERSTVSSSPTQSIDMEEELWRPASADIFTGEPLHPRPTGESRTRQTGAGEGGPSMDVLLSSMLEKVGVMIDARLAPFMERLPPEKNLRPPLGVKAGGGERVPPMPPGKGGKKNKKMKAAAEPPPLINERAAARSKVAPARNVGATKDGKGAGGATAQDGKPGRSQRPTPSGSTPGGLRPTAPNGETWAQVAGRKNGKGQTKSAPTQVSASKNPSAKAGGKKGGGAEKSGGGAKGVAAKTAAPKAPGPSSRKAMRPPLHAAVVLTPPRGEGAQAKLDEAVRLARAAVPSLAALGIAGGVIIKRAATGGILMEVPGGDSHALADRLAAAIRGPVEATGVGVHGPVKTAELRVTGLMDATTPQEVAAALAQAGGCSEGEIKVGEIRRAPSGLGTAWARCPIAAASKVTKAGKVAVGWAAAKVEGLATRPMRCYRCLGMGHTGHRCTSEKDRSGLCYRCGLEGHKAASCSAAPRCALRADLGRPANHRCGGKAYAPPPKSSGGGRKRSGRKKKKKGGSGGAVARTA